MRIVDTIRIAVLGGILILPAACDQVGTASRSGFKTDYLLARVALEGGSYSKAIRVYGDLLNRSGPLEPRIRLEYAHSLLRDDQFAAASTQARMIAGEQEGTARAAALAVQATADHEIARAAMASGDSGPATVSRLKAAKAALDELLKSNAALDPLGSMAERRRAVVAQLAALS